MVKLRVVLLSSVVAAIAIGPPATAEESPFGAIRVAANRSSYRGPCPVSVTFTGNINYVQPHSNFSYSYYWRRSDGSKLAVHNVRPARNARMLVVRESWHLGGPGKHEDIFMTLFVNSGNTHLSQQSGVVAISCR